MPCCASPAPFRANEQVGERVMDSNELEREARHQPFWPRTQLSTLPAAKSILSIPPATPILGGEVERALKMVDE